MITSAEAKCGGKKVLSYGISGNKDSLESSLAVVENENQIPFEQTILLLGYLCQRNKNTHKNVYLEGC